MVGVPKSFREPGAIRGKEECDLFLPEEKLGVACLPLVLVDHEAMAVMVPSHAKGAIEIVGRGKIDLAEARRSARPSAALEGACTVPLVRGERARIEIGLPDAAVIQCTVQALYSLSFPPPTDGIVSVVYPITFSPD
jgi:hypothetical protein